MITIRKDQLATVQSHRGQLDTDSRRVFVGVRGGMNPKTHLYELEVDLRDPEDKDDLIPFSLQSILNPAKPEVSEPIEEGAES
jgi:hypothetical protein